MEINNQGLWTAHYLARATGESQRLVISARNGRSINDWHDGSVTGPQYARILAICDQAGISKFDWFGWNQGSADNSTASTYRARWDALVAKMERMA
ncbi:hypothetical protein [Rhizobium rhizophilum]|uniref:Uncharacterized protein n=1 Tax=Rhizobium rhizophilum TaxID=1850373 RepID=A0ABY2QN38_9HYPH|nr:hypothetical protein [Rhizobium rhizophilum]THV10583.1 hypothetical protein E9677_22790 [Rhizobium rhizophilum]